MTETKIEKLAKLLNVAQITEEYRGNADLQISEWLTADGYDVHVMTMTNKILIGNTTYIY